jgi:hypothetical protein
VIAAGKASSLILLLAVLALLPKPRDLSSSIAGDGSVVTQE